MICRILTKPCSGSKVGIWWPIQTAYVLECLREDTTTTMISYLVQGKSIRVILGKRSLLVERHCPKVWSKELEMGPRLVFGVIGGSPTILGKTAYAKRWTECVNGLWFAIAEWTMEWGYYQADFYPGGRNINFAYAVTVPSGRCMGMGAWEAWCLLCQIGLQVAWQNKN